MIIAIWPIKNSGDIIILDLVILSAIFFIFEAYINSEILTPFHYLWIKFGLFLSKIVSPIIMFYIFWNCFTNWYFYEKIIGKDLFFKKNIPLKVIG